MSHVTEFLGVEYSSPLWAASGTFGWGLEALDGGFFPKRGLSSFVTKGVSPKPMLGAPQPRIAEVGHGTALLNAIGLQNPGLRAFLQSYVTRYDAEIPVPVWVNAFADSVDGFVEVIDGIRKYVTAKRSNWLAGFELNVSCPNVDKGGCEFGTSRELLEELVEASVRAATARFPVMVKLSPHAADIVELAKACEGAGAAALSIANTFPAGFPIPETGGWALGRRFGGMSGPGLRPIALRLIDLVANKVKLPICGIGGIQSAHDVKEFLSAGAKVVQVGTAHFANPWICQEIVDHL